MKSSWRSEPKLSFENKEFRQVLSQLHWYMNTAGKRWQGHRTCQMKKFLVSAVGDTRMLSFFCTVIFEDMAGLLEKSDRIEINWVSNDIDLRDYDDSYWIEKQEDETDAEFAARESNPNKRNLAPKDSTFLGQIAPTDLHTEILTAEIVGARWGIEMFPIAKNVSMASLDAYTVNRPRAVCGALHLSDEQAELINGDEFKPVYKTLRAIKMAFDLRPGFRYAFGDIWVRWVKQTAAGPKLGFNITFQ
jgi:hypothetical protein